MEEPGRQLTEEDARESLQNHILVKAGEARAKYGNDIGHAEILEILDDREVVRYPVRLVFACDALHEGEFGFVQPIGKSPAEGFILHIHPAFKDREDVLPLLIAYQLVVVNYGEIATGNEAELFGATLLGIDVDDYYERLCTLADSLS